MPYDVKKFVFTVSLCAMLAANPVLASAPGQNESIGSAHDVYVESTLNQAENGIAGVGYVNRMVDAAGNAAQMAENHAAAAGASAISAAESAQQAHKVLEDKVDIDQGADNKNKVMVTDENGSVYAGYIGIDMINTTYVNASGVIATGLGVLKNYDGRISWARINENDISPNTITSHLIADDSIDTSDIQRDAITNYNIRSGAVTADKISGPSGSNTFTGVLGANGLFAEWRKIVPADTAGVVGMVPVGAEGATTYGSFWIE